VHRHLQPDWSNAASIHNRFGMLGCNSWGAIFCLFWRTLDMLSVNRQSLACALALRCPNGSGHRNLSIKWAARFTILRASTLQLQHYQLLISSLDEFPRATHRPYTSMSPLEKIDHSMSKLDPLLYHLLHVHPLTLNHLSHSLRYPTSYYTKWILKETLDFRPPPPKDVHPSLRLHSSLF